MKNLSKLIMLSSFLLVGACNAPERTIGFVTGDNAEMQWHLGTQDAIDIVSTVDEINQIITVTRLIVPGN